ncbi:MAG: Ig-like domain-containing protein [Bacteroidota bacterium]
MRYYILLLIAVLTCSLTHAQVNAVKEINDSGTSSSSPANLFVYKGKVYFGADDSNGSNTEGQDLGKELWVTDGTEAGTSLVADLRTGDASSSPSFFFEYNGIMYFSANAGSGNVLFSSDGTAAGTSATGGDFVFNPVEFGGLIYYVNTTDGNGLYQFDGTTQENVADAGSGVEALVGAVFIPFGDKLLCYMDYSTDEATVGRELYEYDPSTDRFTLIKDITGDDSDAGISNFTILGSEVYFEALSGLWKTDGTEAGTIEISAVATASIGGVNNVYAWNDLLFFEGDDGTGDQLWKYDPVQDAVTNLSNISGTNTNHDPSDYVPAGGFLYYRGEDAEDTDGHLWRTDGTAVEQLDNTIKDVDDMVLLGDQLLFEGDNGMTGNELFGYAIPTTLATEVQVSGESSMLVGTTQTLEATIVPVETFNQTVTWSSSDDAVATVSENGLVTAIRAGTVTITAMATDGSGETGTISIEINPVLVSDITVMGDDEMIIGTSQTLTATILPENATDNSITWSSSDDNIATVDETGQVSAVSAGMVTITATANDDSGQSGTISIQISPILITSITISGDEEMDNGTTQTLIAVITPENPTDGSLTWSSSDQTVATVDDSGLVSAIGPGSVTISATANDGSEISGNIMITVREVLSATDEPELKLWPNPADDFIKINLPASSLVRSFVIYNLEGKVILDGKIQDEINTIDVSSLQKGLYLLEIETSGETLKKFKFMLR